ncbi:hypothetical protein [Azospirillum sp. TSA6c]|uniref:hypothetical protein n=1 Tax=Azospirillum sp. TSA6c TaxID=709813 RepID=UPI0011B7AC12|nr:hypothetical protein [Azospirillum sp. TSA6c]
MDKPIPALPYCGPSHSVDVLERVVKRELLHRGVAWSDLSDADRNARLDDARELLPSAMRAVKTDPIVDGPSLFPSGAIQTFAELDALIGTLAYLAMAHGSRLQTASIYLDALRVHG